MDFDYKKFLGTWKELERYVKPGARQIYPVDACDVQAEYTYISENPLMIGVVNSFTWLCCLPFPVSISGIATGKGRNLNVDFQFCCCSFKGGKYEVIDFEEENGVYTHLFVGSGDDRYRWILVRDLNHIDFSVIFRFKARFPNHEFVLSLHSS